MMRALFIATCLLASASPGHAHPGHGTAPGPMHFVVEPEHAGLTLLVVVVIACGAGWAWRRVRSRERGE